MPNPLPPFDPAFRVDPAKARQDKLEFSCPLGFIADTETDSSPDAFASHVLTFLGGPPDRDVTTLTGDDAYSRFFGRRRGGGGHELRVREHLPAPLFAGKLQATRTRLGRERLNFRFTSIANLTRYVRHQDAGRVRRGVREITDTQALVETLFSRAVFPALEEYSFDDRDNWIPQVSVQTALGHAWTERQREYLAAILSSMRGELERVVRYSGSIGHPLTIRHASGLSLTKIETYWEFSSHDPLALVTQIEPHLRAYCEGDFERNSFWDMSPQFSTAFQRTREHNCNVLVAKVAPGIKIVVYAKTNKRVRFEVRHDLGKVSSLRRLPKTCDDVNAAVERLGLVSVDSANVLNRFLEHLHSQHSFVSASPSPVEFLFSCVQTAVSAGYAESIVSMLISNDCVVAIQPLRPSLARMVRAGLLQRVANEQRTQSQVYQVVPRFRNALRLLQQMQRPGAVTTQQRLRTRLPEN